MGLWYEYLSGPMLVGGMKFRLICFPIEYDGEAVNIEFKFNGKQIIDMINKFNHKKSVIF